MPEEVKFSNDDEEGGEEAEEEKVPGDGEEGKEEALEEEKEEEKETELTPEEWDLRVIEAFKRAIYESIKEVDLPMEPSDFMKNHLLEYQLEDFTPIDLRKTTFKKIGKLLEVMSTGKNGAGIIAYEENKIKGHKMIFRVFREQLTDFVPEYKLKRIRSKAGNEESKSSNTLLNYPLIKVEEVYTLGKHLAKMNASLKQQLT